MGRFLTRDTWSGDENQPLSFNLWNYAYSNPVNLTDPTGNFPAECLEASNFAQCLREWISESRDDCAGSSGWKPLGNFNLSSYYITDESQYYSKGSASRPVPSLGGESFNKYFLFSNAGVCMQGTGKTRGGDYISCTSHMQWVQDTDDDTPGCANKVRNGDKSMCPWRYFMPPDMPSERENKPFSFRAGLPDFVIPFETVAIGNNVPLTAHDGKIEIRIMSKILTDLFHNYPPASNSDNIFTVTDVGRGLNGIDIYLGEQPTSCEDPNNIFVQRFANKIQDIPDTFIEWRYKK